MNILLIHLNPLGISFQLGLSYIASILREKGHNVDFLLLSWLKEGSLVNKISRNNPQIVMLSVVSDAVDLCKEIVRFIDTKYNLPMLLGGVHPTLYPEELIKLKGVLGVCVGEGEYPVVELTNAIEENRNYTSIKNLWVKKDDLIYRNDLRPLIQDLDNLPFPDYGIFAEYINFKTLPVILSRGCPFLCSYCCNHALKKIYGAKENYVRFHSVSYGLNLIKGLLDKIPSAKEIEFYDDTFTINKAWLENFLGKFSKFGIKFICNSRFDLLTEDIIKILSRSGCARVNAAIECGNEEIRKRVCNRNINDSDILRASNLLKKYNIKLHTHNMLGLPYETEKDILKTVELNKRAQVQSVQVSIFRPYGKTELGELCVKNNWVNNRLKPKSYMDFTILNSAFIKPHLVNYYFLIFNDMVFKTGMLLKLKKIFYWLIHFKNNWVYLIIRNLKIKIRSMIRTEMSCPRY